ncbi:uncharacterized protein LOC136061784 isoform X5 [Quercus suber]|uniref:uncharacterized protein LOC136061784 isoform X5 n=1 Tax=Quercus suber TaxID=58331 RepID=UPI0032DF2A3E
MAFAFGCCIKQYIDQFSLLVQSGAHCCVQGKLVLAPLMEFETSTTKNLFDYFPQCLKESNCFGLIEWQIELLFPLQMMVPLSIQPIS